MKCAAPLQPGQDWCLQCGAGAPGSLDTSSWHAGGAILAIVAVLVLGAAAAGYAALSKGTPKARTVTTTVAQTSPPATTTPATTTPIAPGTTATTPSAQAKLPSSAVKPPKIPLTAVTPTPVEKVTKSSTPQSKPTATTTTPSSTSPSGTGNKGESTGEELQQSAIELDTNAAAPYNPYNYPTEWFGDPTLAIDGDTSTAWTAQVNPASAPAMAEGLLLDLKAKHKVAVLQLVTSTTGMVVRVYGANGQTVPASITDPAWVPLSSVKLVKKKRTRFKLRDSRKAFTYITLWISKAPASAVGTATAPGHVDVNEIELFPTR